MDHSVDHTMYDLRCEVLKLHVRSTTSRNKNNQSQQDLKLFIIKSLMTYNHFSFTKDSEIDFKNGEQWYNFI